MSLTIASIFDLWKGIKRRREAVELSQRAFALRCRVSHESYTRHEKTGQHLTLDQLYRYDGILRMLESGWGYAQPVDNSVDNIGDTEGTTEGETDLSTVKRQLPPKISPARKGAKRRKKKGKNKLS